MAFAQYNTNSFDFTQYTSYQQDLEDEHEPDVFFETTNMNCTYYTSDVFCQNVDYGMTLSIIHFNSRSMHKNYTSIKEYLQQFSHSFSVIAVSETWFKEDNIFHFELEGYDLNYINRLNKPGGGVALYVKKDMKFKIITHMTMTIDNVLECLTIEICCEKRKNVIITCVYRTPGSNMEQFIQWIEKMFSDVRNKTVFICGDFNIDLMNPNKHKSTDDFIQTLYSMSFYPTINKPSRITTHSATLIDNIFTNNIESNKRSGLLTCDITDHLPVFTMYDYEIPKIPTQKYFYKRLRTDNAINSLKNDLSEQNWDMVYNVKDVNQAYNNFLKIFCSLYNKKLNKRHKSIKSPWLTRGLEKACKKKNTLYKKF
ncbi:uncharacterized protein LOC112151929, partial [Oryzias melastigma]|uniref:uncharacterized protein LOC112151929 n=1 Tax=Oryzias melastigma TaxID=30732 RepID=UPI000CF837AC